MKIKLMILALGLAMLIMAYSAFAFVEWAVDPAKWSWFSRMLMVFIGWTIGSLVYKLWKTK
jgi:hypothetical protein